MINIIIVEDSKFPFDSVVHLVRNAVNQSSVSPKNVRVLAIANKDVDTDCFPGFQEFGVFTPTDFSSLASRVRRFLPSTDRLALFLDFHLIFDCVQIVTMEDMRTVNSLPYLFWKEVIANSPGCFVRTMTMGNDAVFRAATSPSHSFDSLSLQLDPFYAKATDEFRDWLDNDFQFPGGDFPSDEWGTMSADGRERTRAGWFAIDHQLVPHDLPAGTSYTQLVTSFISDYVGSFPDFLEDVPILPGGNVLHEHLKQFVGKYAAFDNDQGEKGLSFLGALLLIIRGCRSKGKRVTVSATDEGGIGGWLKNTEKKSVVRDPARSRAVGRALYELGSGLGHIGIKLSEHRHGSERLPIISIGVKFDLCSGEGSSMCLLDAVLPPLNANGWTDAAAGATGRALNRFLLMSSRTGSGGHMPMFRVSVDSTKLTLTALPWVD